MFASSQEEHDQRLAAVLDRLREANVTLNSDKCEFSKSSVTFLGQVIDHTGIRSDPNKVNAIVRMKTPESISELRRFLGMTTQLNKFSPFIADRTKPLRDLLVKNTEWRLGHQQAAAFGEIKKELSSSRTLGQYNPNSKTVIAADASSFGLGAVIFQQQQNGDWMPIAYASRALTATESHYAQIEKEALAITRACEKFNDYELGMKFHIQTEHKPLLSLLGNRNLDDLPARVQIFRMRMMKYHYTIEHVPGKELVIADTLSRAPVSKPTAEDTTLGEQVYAHVSQVFESLPATSDRLKQIKVTQEKDRDIQLLRKYLINGWPDKICCHRN